MWRRRNSIAAVSIARCSFLSSICCSRTWMCCGSTRVPIFAWPNAAKRFIILTDTFYDHAVKLLASADAVPQALYQASAGFEVLEFRRTASRLIEMQSQSYLRL